MARYLVTGAAGFIGAALASRLIKEGNQVVTIDNLSTGNISNIPDGVEFIEGDCGNQDVYSNIPNDPYDAIFHIAGQSSGEISFDDPIYDIRTNAESTLLLLKFALKNNCKRFIFASTMSVYGIKPERPVKENEDCHPESFYGIAKLASEHYLRVYEQFGIDTTSLRLFNVYGPGQNMDNLRQGMVSIFLAQMLKDKRIHVKGSADRFRDFIHVDDTVKVKNWFMTNPKVSGIFNVGTGVSRSFNDIAKCVLDYFGKGKIQYIDFPANLEEQYQAYTEAKITKIQEKGYNEKFLSLEDGVKAYLKWLSN